MVEQPLKLINKGCRLKRLSENETISVRLKKEEVAVLVIWKVMIKAVLSLQASQRWFNIHVLILVKPNVLRLYVCSGF